MKLEKIFNIKKNDVITLTGGGGKTTLLFRLSKELNQFGRVLITTTTNLFVPEKYRYENLYLTTEKNQKYYGLSSKIDVLGSQIIKEKDKFVGVSEDEIKKFVLQKNRKEYDFILVEGDGSRQKPIKLWKEYEPVIPSFTTKIIGVANIKAIGKTFEEVVHRTEKTTEIFTKDDFQKHIENPDFFKGFIENKNVEKYIFINGIEKNIELNFGLKFGNNFNKNNIKVVLGSMFNREIYCYKKIGAVILAAGSSKRFGENKLLYEIKGELFLEKILKNVNSINFYDKILVTTEETLEEFKKLRGEKLLENYKIIINNNSEVGQSESIKLGVKNSLSEDLMFFSGDQINLTSDTILKLIHEHFKKNNEFITLPTSNKERFNPVIFPEKIKEKLLKLEGDIGGRQIIKEEKNINEIEFEDAKEFQDIDTKEELKKLN